jgi:hypothetical protein
MSKEDIVEPVTAEVVENPAEAKARDNGWAPLGEWRGKEEDWVNYDMFNVKGELMTRIQEQSSIINHMKNKVSERDGVIEDMSALQNQLTERAYKEALRDLTARKKEAFEDSNFDGLVEIDEEINDLKAAKPAPVAAAQEPQGDGVAPEVVEWLQKPEQSWYHTNDTLRGMAEGIAGVALQSNPNLTPTELIRHVDKTIRKEMPQHFNNSGEVDEGGEQNGSPRRGRGKLPSFSSLTEEQRAVATRFERVGAMTKTEYIKSLVELGEIE